MSRSSAVAPRIVGGDADSCNVLSSSDRLAVFSDCRLPNAEEQKINGDGNEDDEEEYEEIEVEVYEEIEEEIEVDDFEEEEVEVEEEVEEEEEVEGEEEEDKKAGEGIKEEEVEIEIREEEEDKKAGEGLKEEREVEEEEEEEEEEEDEEEEEEEEEDKIAGEGLNEEKKKKEEEEDEDMPDTLKEANVELTVKEEDEQEEQENMPVTSKDANGKCSDISQVTDFEWDDMQPELNHTSKKFELRPHSISIVEDILNSKCTGSSPSNELLAKDELYVHSEDSKCLKPGEDKSKGEKDVSQEPTVRKSAEELMMKAHFNDSKVVAVETNNHHIDVASNALAMKDCFDQEEVKSMELSLEDNEEKTASRFSGSITSEMMTQNLCPSDELRDQSKCSDVICDFFAKGWCIRGTSCRFLHINNKADNALEGDSEAAFFSKSDQFDEGLSNIMEKPKVPSNHDPMVSSIGNDDIYSCDISMERIFQLANKEKQVDDKDNYSSLQQEGLGFSSYKDIGIQNHRQKWHSADYVSPINRGSSLSLQNSLLPEHRSYVSGSAATLSNNHGLNSSSYLSSLEHQIYLRSRSLREAKFDDPLSSSHKLPSPHILALAGSSFSFGSSLNTGLKSSQNLLRNDTDYIASTPSSLLRSASPLSNSGRESLPLASNHGGNWHAADNGRYVSPIDRGSSPSHHSCSVPEHRSYLSGSGVTISKYHGLNSSSCSSTSETQTYVRSQSLHGTKVDDSLSSSCALASHQSASTEPSFSFGSYLNRSPSDSLKMFPNDRDYNTSRLASFLQSASPLSGPDRANMPFNSLPRDLLCYAMHKKKISSEKRENSVPFLERGAGGPQNDTYGNGAVTGENCVVVGENGSLPDEEIGSSNVHQKDVPNASTVNVASSTGKDDGHKHKKVKVNRESQNSEVEVDKKSCGDSKAMRQFRVALVDVIKELLKPSWNEGHLSKDAHNTIVKKAEEKVLGSLEPHQIPSTMESIKLYLSASQPKIAKLVEGYYAKYRKS